MNATPGPTSRLTLLHLDAVLRHRWLFCPEYDACLSLAANAGWTSWTCEECPFARALLREVGAPGEVEPVEAVGTGG